MRFATCTALALVFAIGSVAWAAPQLTVTEIYVGVSGDDITEDWFEITNFGDTAWDLTATPLYYLDDRTDLSDATPIQNISLIEPNESVVVVAGDIAGLAEFVQAWDYNGSLSGVKVGYSDGKGLGQSSDAVQILDSVDGAGSYLTSQAYNGIGVEGATMIYNPITQAFEGNSVVGQFGAYVAPGGPAGGDADEGIAGTIDLIGSPGVVPEPATLMLMAFGAIGLLRRR